MNNQKLPKPFSQTLGVSDTEHLLKCFDSDFIFSFLPEEMQKCLEMLYVYGYEV